MDEMVNNRTLATYSVVQVAEPSERVDIGEEKVLDSSNPQVAVLHLQHLFSAQSKFVRIDPQERHLDLRP